MNPVIAWLVEPFSFPFMVRGFWAALIVGIVVPVLGSYVVLRGMAFFGDALAHIMLPGVVIAFLIGWPLAIGGLAAGVIAALLIGAISQGTSVREDAAIGVVFAGAFALGVALLSIQRSYAVDLAHFLFGNLLGVSWSDLRVMLGLGALVLLAVFALYKEFLVLSFDPTLATTLRLPIGLLQTSLLVLIAVVVVVSIQAVGVALILAMLVTPATAASLLARRLPSMMVIASGLGALASVAGVYMSFYWNVASGPAIVLVETALFGLIFLIAPGRGLLPRWRRRQAVGG